VTHTFNEMNSFVSARRRNWKGWAISFTRARENGCKNRVFSFKSLSHAL